MTRRALGTALFTLLLACTGPAATDQVPWEIPSRFVLVAVNGQPLPAQDSVGFARVLNGVMEVYHPESLRVVRTSRHLIRDRLPCQVLRDIGEATGTVGLVAVTDTSTTGCDELRGAETDTHVVAYQRLGERLHIPDATVYIRGDTLILEDEVREVDMDGPSRIRTRTQRYVRVATPALSREPQN